MRLSAVAGVLLFSFFAFFLSVGCNTKKTEQISCVTPLDCPYDWYCEDGWCVEFPDAEPSDGDTADRDMLFDGDSDKGTDADSNVDADNDNDAEHDGDTDSDADGDAGIDADVPADDLDDAELPADDGDELLSDEETPEEEGPFPDSDTPLIGDAPLPEDDTPVVDDIPVPDIDVKPPMCGDGQIDSGEQCDDNNTDDQDGCRNDCTINHCWVSGWTNYGGHCYKRYGTANWTTAQSACRWHGGDLTTVDDMAENGFINSLAAGQRCWIGANDRSSEGVWTWSDGSAWNYSNWSSGEPNNDEHDCNIFGNDCDYENCAEILVGGAWNDGDCGDWKYHVCERPNEARCEYRIVMADTDGDGWCMYFDSESGYCYQNHYITVTLNGSNYGDFWYDTYSYGSPDIWLPALPNGSSIAILFTNADNDGEWPDDGQESSYRLYNHNGTEVAYQVASDATVTVVCP